MPPPSFQRILSSAGRQWRRHTGLLRRPRADVVYSPEYIYALSAVPIEPLRPELILSFLIWEGLLAPGQIHSPGLASIRSLRRVHTDEYLESLGQPGTLTRVVGVEVSPRQQDRFLRLQRAMVGGTILATQLTLANGRPAVNLGGGLHHAHANRGQGFCILNDVAVAIAELRSTGWVEPILVVDLDLHDGDGTRSVFADDPTVHTYSISNRLWSEAEAVTSTTIQLGDGVDGDAYSTALGETLPPLLRRQRPELVYFLAGADPASGDSIGDWRVSPQAMLDRDRFVFRALRRHCPQAGLVVLLAGGYGTDSWRIHARSLAWLFSGRLIEPPSTEVATLIRYRLLTDILRSTTQPAAGAGEGDWSLTEEDLMGTFTPSVQPRGFLDHYSPHQMELVLERTGLFDRLRALGFEQPTLEVDLANPSGHTLRVFSAPDRFELLAEVRARRDRRTLPGMELLWVEWLLLQNPRSPFSAERPPLPGQRHPGLGMLRDAVALLVLVCERLHLDGMAFVPSHYHLAAQAGGPLQFVDPEAQGRFEALRLALAGMQLAEATTAVAGGRVIDAATGATFAWIPAPMVIAVSDRLAERLRCEEYSAKVQEVAAMYRPLVR